MPCLKRICSHFLNVSPTCWCATKKSSANFPLRFTMLDLPTQYSPVKRVKISRASSSHLSPPRSRGTVDSSTCNYDRMSFTGDALELSRAVGFSNESINHYKDEMEKIAPRCRSALPMNTTHSNQSIGQSQNSFPAKQKSVNAHNPTKSQKYVEKSQSQVNIDPKLFLTPVSRRATLNLDTKRKVKNDDWVDEFTDGPKSFHATASRFGTVIQSPAKIGCYVSPTKNPPSFPDDVIAGVQHQLSFAESLAQISTKNISAETSPGGQDPVKSKDSSVALPSGKPLFLTPTLHAGNNVFASSKVFQARYNAAARTIQKIFQVFVARRAVAILRLAAYELACRHKATEKMQALVRGWQMRLRLQEYKLEFQLRCIEKESVRELADIQKRKVKKMNAIREKYQAKAAKQRTTELQNQESVDTGSEVILYLRKINAEQRASNETVRSAIDQLMAENKMLNDESKKFVDFQELTTCMDAASTDQNLLVAMLSEFELRKAAFEEAIENRDERIMFENRVGRLYFNTVKDIVVAVEESCNDTDLVYEVEALCLELDSTTPRECSF